MKKYLLLFLLVTSALAFQRFRADFPSPGATGLNTTYDVDALRQTDARTLTNVDVASQPGAVINRLALQRKSATSNKNLSVAPYFNAEFGDKMLFAVSEHALISIPKPRALADSVSAGTWYFNEVDLCRITVSENFQTTLYDSTFDYVYPATHIDWLKIYDQLIVTDGAAVPTMLSSRDTKKLAQGTQEYGPIPPVIQYGRRSLSLGLEAPGQLRVMLANKSGNLSGAYQYRIRYAGFDGDSLGSPGIPSATVYPDSQAVLVTLFEGRAFRFKSGLTRDSSVGDSSLSGSGWQIVYLERRKSDADWNVVSWFPMHSEDTLVYVDTVGDSSGTLIAVSSLDLPTRSVPTPGAYYFCNVSDSAVDADGAWAAARLASSSLEIDTYYVAYSYYDPVSDLESPLGPKNYIVGPLSVTGADSLLELAYKGITKLTERPHYIRFYRSLRNDSSAMYCMFQLHANDPYMTSMNGTYLGMGIPVGWGTDAVIQTGLIGEDEPAGPIFSDTNIYVATSDGDPVIRPPYISGCAVPFSDIEWFANRVWGIGDPEFKQRLYYSEEDNIGDIPATNYIGLDEDDNDELVALASADVDILYAFKHNKIFGVTGYDPQYDLQFQTISSRHGAVNANSVVKVSPFVYFLSGDFNLYRLVGGSIDTVSTTVTASIKAMFSSGQSLRNYGRLLLFNDRILLTNDSSGSTLAYYFNENAWATYSTRSTHRFIIGFAYDTLENNSGFLPNDDWLLLGNHARLIKEVNRYGIDSLLDTVSYIPFVYQTPFIGDGENVYEITEAIVSAKAARSTNIRAVVYNSYGDSLMTARLTMDTLNNNYRLGFGPHIGKYLSVRIAADTTLGKLTINDVTLNYRMIGHEKIR